MGLWRNKKALESLQNRLSALEETCDTLQREGKSLRLEWEELYDKVRHQMSRISKRVSQQPPSEEASPSLDGSSEQFADRDPVSRSIMLRRARQGLRK